MLHRQGLLQRESARHMTFVAERLGRLWRVQ